VQTREQNCQPGIFPQKYFFLLLFFTWLFAQNFIFLFSSFNVRELKKNKVDYFFLFGA